VNGKVSATCDCGKSCKVVHVYAGADGTTVVRFHEYIGSTNDSPLGRWTAVTNPNADIVLSVVCLSDRPRIYDVYVSELLAAFADTVAGQTRLLPLWPSAPGRWPETAARRAEQETDAVGPHRID
jgi:hypothetical protein